MSRHTCVGLSAVNAFYQRPIGVIHAIMRWMAALCVLMIASGLALAQSQVTGRWTTLPYLMPINPIHVGLMHTGKVLVVAGSENEPGKHQAESYKAAVWDPNAGTIAVQNLLWDVFCNGMAFLPDGRALIVGGTEQYDPFHGEPRATVFDPATEKFSEVHSMKHGRWYATTTTLADGRILAFSGIKETGSINNAVEMYKVASGWGQEYVAPWVPPLYPWLHLLPNGNIFYSGSSPSSHLFNPSNQTWTLNVARTLYNNSRGYGFSVLLPLLPEKSYAARVMIMGGHSPATATAEIIDLSKPTPAWTSAGSMSKPRIQGSAVLLPDGKVLVLGGSYQNADVNSASLAADLFDSRTGTWAPAGTEAYARLYHSVALLLPDATVWVAGSNPKRGTYEPHMEIYSPPYLFTTDASGNTTAASRPIVTGVPAKIGYGGTFQVQTPNQPGAGLPDVSSVVLVRPGSNTHAWDMEQRVVGLTVTLGSGVLIINGPPNANIAPPGYYMLFVLNNARVPSVASFVQLSSNPDDQPPKGVITSPANDLTIKAGQAVSFAGSATDADGTVSTYSWFFPAGSPSTSLAQNPGSILFPVAGTYVTSLTAVDNRGVNDPSPPTRTITVQPIPTAPSNLTATVVSSSQINLSWGASTETGGTIRQYRVERCQGAGCNKFAQVGTTTKTIFNSAGLSAATTYRYRVRASDTGNTLGPYSNIATATTLAPFAPTAPSSLTATVVGSSQINLSWGASREAGGTISQYLIERCQGTGCNNFIQVATSASITFNNTGLLGSSSYSYRVRAIDTANNPGPYSNVASATTAPPTISAPANLTATPLNSTQIKLGWTAATESGGTVSKYLIERC